jgi:CheY-like chemotaxis protein
MLVDDNEDALRTLAALLEAYGHTEIVAGSGRASIELTVKRWFFILDIGLPDMDGYQLVTLGDRPRISRISSRRALFVVCPLIPPNPNNCFC